jgi:hypothetical protein
MPYHSTEYFRKDGVPEDNMFVLTGGEEETGRERTRVSGTEREKLESKGLN